jgi:hypothetical protein
MSNNSITPRFFIYENKEVTEVTENEHHLWITNNWHPSHMLHSRIGSSYDELFLGFQGHYKFSEWTGKPFNVTYFSYGSEMQLLDVFDEYFATYEEAEARYLDLKENKPLPVQNIEILQAA